MAKKLADVTSYEEASYFLGDRDEKTIANNTRLVERPLTGDRAIAVRLHGTDVLTYVRSGFVVLHSGGYRTVTTKDRINAFLPKGYRVHQRDFTWFVHVSFGGFGETIPFEDGMTLPDDPADYKFA